MEKRFDDYDLEVGFVLDQTDALNYLDYVARQHTEQILIGEEDHEGMTEIMDDICTMKKDILEHNYEYVKFVECQMSASQIDIVPMIEERELRYAIEDMAEWVLNNLDNPVPLIFKSKKDQSLLERVIKERRQQ